MTTNYIIIPRKTTFYNWASQLQFANPKLNIFVPPKDESEWRGWAEYFVFANQSEYPLLPLPSELLYPGNKGWVPWGELSTYVLI